MITAIHRQIADNFRPLYRKFPCLSETYRRFFMIYRRFYRRFYRHIDYLSPENAPLSLVSTYLSPIVAFL